MNFKIFGNGGYINLFSVMLIVLTAGIVGSVIYIKFKSDNSNPVFSEKDIKIIPINTSTENIKTEESISLKEKNISSGTFSSNTTKNLDKQTSSFPQTLQISQIQSKIDALIKNINEISATIKQNGLSGVTGLIDNYKNNFNSFALEANKIDLNKVDKKSIENLRASEWENYQKFEVLKEQVSFDPVLSQKVTEIKKDLDSYLKNQASKSLNQIILKSNKETSNGYNKIISGLLAKSLINFAIADESSRVVHKKIVREVSDLSKLNSSLFGNQYIECWKYESWINLDTGDLRQEQGMSAISKNGKCFSEINIMQGSTGKKLALSVNEKYAEWIKSPKVGIGTEAKSDPYTQFKDNLEKGKWKIENTDTLNGKQVYVLKGFEGRATGGGLKNPYNLMYLDMATYFPVKEISYMDKTIVINNPPTFDFDKTKWDDIVKSWEGREMISSFVVDFVIAEIIKKDSLPSGFFDIIIPEGYEMKEFSGMG